MRGTKNNSSNVPKTPPIKALNAHSTYNIGVPMDKSNVEIREVWADNLHDEISKIVELVDKYNYIAMDTEFPGIVQRPIGTHRTINEYNYQLMKMNVDVLRLIQLGLCLCDSQGNYIPDFSCWQFNFKFDKNKDHFATDSIDLLKKSGIDFNEIERRGIDWNDFAEILTTSGVVLNPKINWISFHSGFDFAYLLKILTNSPLPDNDVEFFKLLRIFCPVIYDIKYVIKSCENLKGGLQKIAETLEVHRIGPQHQAGSDALLTAAAFFKMRTDYFDGRLDDFKYKNIIFGLSCPAYEGELPRPSSHTLSAVQQAQAQQHQQQLQHSHQQQQHSHSMSNKSQLYINKPKPALSNSNLASNAPIFYPTSNTSNTQNTHSNQNSHTNHNTHNNNQRFGNKGKQT